MQRNKYILSILLVLLLLSNTVFCQKRVLLPCNGQLIKSSHDSAYSQIGKRENGYNKGYDIEKLQKVTGIPIGSSYCMAGQYWSFYVSAKALSLPLSEIPIKRAGLCYSVWVDAEKKGKNTSFKPQINDLIIWKNQYGINGHVERIHLVHKGGWVTTIAFNTSSNIKNSQDNGDGNFIKKRNIYNIIGKLRVKGLIGFINK